MVKRIKIIFFVFIVFFAAHKAYSQAPETYIKNGKEKDSAKDYEGAIADFDKAIAKDSGNYTVYLSRAITNYHLHWYNCTIRDCDLAIKLNKNCAEAYNYKGLAESDMQDYPIVVSSINEEIQIDALYSDFQSDTLHMKVDYDLYFDAIKDFNKAIKMNHKFAEAYINRGNVRQKLSQYNLAMDDYHKAIKINPSLAEAYCNRGYIQYIRQNYRAAIASFSQAIKINPSLAKAYNNRGAAKYELWTNRNGKLNVFDTLSKTHAEIQSAIKDFNNAEEIIPRYLIAYWNCAWLNYIYLNYPEALKNYDKAVELSPGLSYLYISRGRIKYRLNNKNGACDDWNKAAALGNNQAGEIVKLECR